MLIREKIVKLLALLTTAIVFSSCSLLPASRTEQAADDAATPTPIPTPVVPVKPTYKVQKGEIVDELTFSGRISPVVEEELFFRAAGRVRAVFSKRNEMVKKGQTVAELEIDALERELNSAQLTLERAEVELASAQRNYDTQIRLAQIDLEKAQIRLDALQGQGAPDAQAVELQQKDVEIAQIALTSLQEAGVNPLLKNDVERASYDVTKLKAEIAEAQIVAPFDGQLLSVSLTPGQAVEAFRPVVTIADVTALEVSAELLSDQMQDLAEDMAVSVVLVSRPGEVLHGKIRQLPYPYGSGGGTATTVEDQDKSTRFTLEESATDAGFAMGDLVRVTAELERKDNVLWVPPQAVRVFDGRRFVVLIDGETRRRVDVKVGIETQDRVEIEEGLEEGQVVEGP